MKNAFTAQAGQKRSDAPPRGFPISNFPEGALFQRPDRGAETVNSKQKSLLAARAALEKKAGDLIILEVADLTTVADYFIICSAESQRQVRTIRDHIDETLSERGCRLFSTEGEEASCWILMDYSDLVIHIFKEELRTFYSLERLWGDAPQLDVAEGTRPGRIVRAKKAAPKKVVNDRAGRRADRKTGGM